MQTVSDGMLSQTIGAHVAEFRVQTCARTEAAASRPGNSPAGAA